MAENDIYIGALLFLNVVNAL